MLYARYDAGKNVNGRIVNRETVYGIQKAELTIFSPQFSTKGTYVYQGINKDKHIAMICEDIKITGRYQPFEKGIVWNTERGAKFWLDGVGFIPKCQVTLTFRKGSESRSWDWNFDSWRKGEEKSFDTPVGQLTFDPDYIDMLISFPETSYKHDVDLTIKK